MKKHTLFLSCLMFILISCNKPTENKIEQIDEGKEIAAIEKVIKNETDCFFAGNYDCWKTSWSHEPYAMQAWNNDDNTFDAAVGWEKIDAQGKGWIEKYYKGGKNIIHPLVKKEKPIIKFFNGNLAYLIWRQYNANKDKTVYAVSQETRLMEKENGEWKIVNVTALWDAKNKIPFDSLKIE